MLCSNIKVVKKQHTWTISLTKLKPPGPIRDPASKYPVITCNVKTIDHHRNFSEISNVKFHKASAIVQEQPTKARRIN